MIGSNSILNYTIEVKTQKYSEGRYYHMCPPVPSGVVIDGKDFNFIIYDIDMDEEVKFDVKVNTITRNEGFSYFELGFSTIVSSCIPSYMILSEKGKYMFKIEDGWARLPIIKFDYDKNLIYRGFDLKNSIVYKIKKSGNNEYYYIDKSYAYVNGKRFDVGKALALMYIVERLLGQHYIIFEDEVLIINLNSKSMRRFMNKYLKKDKSTYVSGICRYDIPGYIFSLCIYDEYREGYVSRYMNYDSVLVGDYLFIVCDYCGKLICFIQPKYRSSKKPICFAIGCGSSILGISCYADEYGKVHIACCSRECIKGMCIDINKVYEVYNNLEKISNKKYDDKIISINYNEVIEDEDPKYAPYLIYCGDYKLYYVKILDKSFGINYMFDIPFLLTDPGINNVILYTASKTYIDKKFNNIYIYNTSPYMIEPKQWY